MFDLSIKTGKETNDSAYFMELAKEHKEQPIQILIGPRSFQTSGVIALIDQEEEHNIWRVHFRGW